MFLFPKVVISFVCLASVVASHSLSVCVNLKTVICVCCRCPICVDVCFPLCVLNFDMMKNENKTFQMKKGGNEAVVLACSVDISLSRPLVCSSSKLPFVPVVSRTQPHPVPAKV